MQELVLLLSSIAGVATAAAVKKFPKNKPQLLSLGASSTIKSQINSLKIEKDVITKTITRLYQENSDFSKIQKDRLLLKYQHQLGIVLAKLEKLEVASQHPDLGPVGDGLITLMDQKLSKFDDRLYEISSKISVKQTPEIKESEITKIKPTESETKQIPTEKPKQQEKITPIEIPPTKTQPFELTTLTSLRKIPSKFPLIEEKNVEAKYDNVRGITEPQEFVSEIIKPKQNIQEKKDVVQSSPTLEEIKAEFERTLVPKFPTPRELPESESKAKPTVNLPEDIIEEDDEDDLDKIKGEILKTLSKLEQAEVE